MFRLCCRLLLEFYFPFFLAHLHAILPLCIYLTANFERLANQNFEEITNKLETSILSNKFSSLFSTKPSDTFTIIKYDQQ